MVPCDALKLETKRSFKVAWGGLGCRLGLLGSEEGLLWGAGHSS